MIPHTHNTQKRAAMVRALEAATRFRNRSSSIAQAVAAEREAELQREERRLMGLEDELTVVAERTNNQININIYNRIPFLYTPPYEHNARSGGTPAAPRENDSE
jgi:hypothetical protein